MNYMSYDNMAELLPFLAAKIGGGSGTSIKDWVASTTYVVGDLVIYQNSLYKCITANNDSTFDETKWQEIGGGVDFPEWQANTSYEAGDYLVHQGTVYKVVNDFTSGTTFSDTDLTPYISPIMKGATSSANGEAGMVIKPTTADINKFLCGDGTWKDAGSNGGANVIGDILFDTSTQILDNTIINLSKPYTDYDYLIIDKVGSGYDCILVDTGEVSGKTFICTTYSDNVLFSFDILSTTQFKIYGVTDSSSSSRLYRITGIKFVNPNVYSTTEQRIGTWIDGKPLYQKTISFLMPDGSGMTDLIVSNLPYINILTEIYGFTQNGVIINSAETSTHQFSCIVWWDTANKNLMLYHHNLGDKTAYITIKYTKTTD